MGTASLGSLGIVVITNSLDTDNTVSHGFLLDFIRDIPRNPSNLCAELRQLPKNPSL